MITYNYKIQACSTIDVYLESLETLYLGTGVIIIVLIL